MSEIQNKVKQSGLITLDLEQYLPSLDEVLHFDIAPLLFQGLILREKDFRSQLKETDWTQYVDHQVLVYCSADAIIPDWAYMLVASYLVPIAADIHYGDEHTYMHEQFCTQVRSMDVSEYADQRVIIKGCGSEYLGAYAYFEISRRLLPVVQTLMYGEPCSTVPVYKRKAPTTTK